MFTEFFAPQSFCDTRYLLGVGFETALRWRNRWYGFEAVRPIVDLSCCDPMSALTVSVMAIAG